MRWESSPIASIATMATRGSSPALMREDPRYAQPFKAAAALLTIHNAGAGYHQEVWDPGFAALLTGLPASVLGKGMLGTTVDPLLLAGSYARLVTVSERYAEELLGERDREMSGGLGRVLRERGIGLLGVTNGIDPNPSGTARSRESGASLGFDPSQGISPPGEQMPASPCRRLAFRETQGAGRAIRTRQ